MDPEQSVRDKFALLGGLLDERSRRVVAAAEALALGPGGISAVSRATGLARSTIRRGIEDLASGEQLAAGRVRRSGAGPKRKADEDPTLLDDLEAAFGAIADYENSVAKGLNQLGREQRASFEVLTKGLLAVAKIARDQATVIKAQGERFSGIENRQDEIAKAMGRPIPPRSVLTGASAIPAPYEAAGVVKGGVKPGQDATTDGISAMDVLKSARAELDDITKGGVIPDINQRSRVIELSGAIGRCESGGIDPVAIMGEYNIKVA